MGTEIKAVNPSFKSTEPLLWIHILPKESAGGKASTLLRVGYVLAPSVWLPI